MRAFYSALRHRNQNIVLEKFPRRIVRSLLWEKWPINFRRDKELTKTFNGREREREKKEIKQFPHNTGLLLFVVNVWHAKGTIKRLLITIKVETMTKHTHTNRTKRANSKDIS
jgi:hypothetical protein